MKIQQLVYILLHLQFFVCDVFTFNVNFLWRKDTSRTDHVIPVNNWKCVLNEECTAINSTCINNLCQCAPGYIFNANMTSCIRVAAGLLDWCEETLQCSAYLLSGAKCIDNVCVCGPGYYYLHGRCNRYVGLYEKCKQNIDCYVNADFAASTCDAVEGICKCSPGFYQREYRTCRRKGKAVGDECTIDIDCTFENGYCETFVCMKAKSQNVMELSTNAALSINNFEDNQVRVGGNCTIDKDCVMLGNATCGSDKTCRCNRAYFASDTGTECIPEIGETCQSSDEIKSRIKKTICRGGMWSCTKGTIASTNNRECRRTTRKYNENCHEDRQCNIFGPDAECRDKKCMCNENSHYVESELFCWINRGIGETCIQNQDCYVKNFKSQLVCNGTCGCPTGTHLNKDKTACINSSTGLGGICEADDDCATPKSVCDNKVCACAENYYQLNDKCLAGINSTCTNDKDCKPENSACTSNICSCKPDYLAIATNSCIPILSYGKPCLEDIQCSTNTSGAICASIDQNEDITDVTKSLNNNSKICTCSKEHYYKFEKCLKKRFLGETCTNIGECYASFNENSVICMNGECTCNWGYMKRTNNICLKSLELAYSLDDGAANMTSMGLLWILLLIFSCNFL